MSPTNSNGRFYEVVVAIEEEDNKGKIKKKAFKYLIDAADTNQAEKNTYKLMDGTMSDWEIVSIAQSKVKEVFMMEDEE